MRKDSGTHARLPAHGLQSQSRRWRHRTSRNAQRPLGARHSTFSKRWALRGTSPRPPVFEALGARLLEAFEALGAAGLESASACGLVAEGP